MTRAGAGLPVPTAVLSPRGWARYIREFTWLSASNQVASLCSLFTTILLARTVPMTVVGQVAFAQSAATLAFLLLDPRFEDALQHYIPVLRRESAVRARALYWRLLRWDLTLGAGFVTVACLLWLVHAIPETQVWRPGFVVLAMCAVGAGSCTGTLHVAFAVTDGLTKLGRISMAAALAGAAVTAVGVWRFGAVGYLAGVLIATIVQVCLLLPYGLRHLGPPVRMRRVARQDRALPKGFLRFLASTSASTSVSMGGDSGMLAVAGFSGGADLVAVLRIATAPGRIVQSIFSPVAAQAFPRLASFAAAGDRDSVRRLTWNASRLLALPAAVVVAGSVPLMRPALGILYGARYEVAAMIGVLFVLAAALRLLAAWSKVLPLAVGRPGLRLVAVAVESGTGVLAALVMPRLWTGSIGAGVGIGIVAVAVAAGLAGFWFWTARRPDLLPAAERGGTDPGAVVEGGGGSTARVGGDGARPVPERGALDGRYRETRVAAEQVGEPVVVVDDSRG